MSSFNSEGNGVLSKVRKDDKQVFYIRYGWRGTRAGETTERSHRLTEKGRPQP